MIIDAAIARNVPTLQDWLLCCTPIPLDTLRPLALRDPAEKYETGGDPRRVIEDDPKDDSVDPEKAVVCRQCRSIVTKPDEAIGIQGSHRHTFANPQGIVFEIGCFRFAQGCAFVGPLTEEFSWFKGFLWRVALCSTCMAHLGWLYLSPSGDSFYGLILDRLIQPT